MAARIKKNRLLIASSVLWRALFIGGLALPTLLQAQISTKVDTTKYVFPIHKSHQSALSSGFGELRSTHFHAGIDIRAQAFTTVHAVAKGYISRIKIQEQGYGWALYIRHPNGYTSVYSHLSSFSKKIGRWVTEEQYKRRSYTVDLAPLSWQFPIEAGEVIARSGNTGNSTGPHLHFEIRDKRQRPLDPTRICAFSELKDPYPPQIIRLAFITMDIDARINGQFGRFEVEIEKQGKHYSLPTNLELEGYIGTEVLVKEVYAEHRYGHGASTLQLMLDDTPYFEQKIRILDFSKQKQIGLHLNLEQYVQASTKFSRMYMLSGNSLAIYPTLVQNGLFFFEKGSGPHSLQLKVQDSFGNSSTLHSILNSGDSTRALASNFQHKNGYKLYKNTLLIHIEKAELAQKDLLLYLSNHLTQSLQPSYQNAGQHVYLWDLRQGIPTFAHYTAAKSEKSQEIRSLSFDIQALVPPNRFYRVANEHLRIDFPPESLYDTLYLRFNKKTDAEHERFVFHNTDAPLKKAIRFGLKVNSTYLWDKTSAYEVQRERLTFHPTTWQDEEAQFESRHLGHFVLLTDTIAPTLLRVRQPSKQLVQLFVKEEHSGIASWEATLNGEWLLMEHYPKQREDLFQARALPKRPLKGSLSLYLRDKQGNESTYTYQIKP